MIQVYCQLSNYLSVSNVSRNLCTQMQRAGLRFYVWGLGNLNNPYLDAPFDQGMVQASIAIGVGYPPEIANCLEGHVHRIMITVCETDQIPKKWVTLCNKMTEIYVPSEFCKTAFQNSGVRIPVSVLRHGVTNVPVRGTPSPYSALVHFSGSVSFARRKGTVRLLRAWGKFLDETRADLHLHVYSPVPEKLQEIVDEIGAPCVAVQKQGPFGLNPQDMRGLLLRYQGIVAPSRAEGFGILPLEARCVGTPVIATNCTGHTEHWAPCDTPIETSESGLLRTQGNDVGRAPKVSESAIVAGLTDFYYNLESRTNWTHKWAQEHCEYWSWRNQLQPFVRHLKMLSRRYKQPKQLGAGVGNG